VHLESAAARLRWLALRATTRLFPQTVAQALNDLTYLTQHRFVVMDLRVAGLKLLGNHLYASSELVRDRLEQPSTAWGRELVTVQERGFSSGRP